MGLACLLPRETPVIEQLFEEQVVIELPSWILIGLYHAVGLAVNGMVISFENDLMYLNASKLVIEDHKKLELQWLAIQGDKSLDVSVFPVSSKWVLSRDSTILMMLTVMDW